MCVWGGGGGGGGGDDYIPSHTTTRNTTVVNRPHLPHRIPQRYKRGSPVPHLPHRIPQRYKRGSPVPHLPQNIPQQYKRRFPCTTPTAWNTTAVQKEVPLYHTYRMEYHSSTKGGSPVPHLPHGIPQQYKRRLPCTTPTAWNTTAGQKEAPLYHTYRMEYHSSTKGGSPVPHLPHGIPQQDKRRFPCTTPTAWNTTAVQKEVPLYHTYRMEYHSSTKGGSPVPHLPHGIPQRYKRGSPVPHLPHRIPQRYKRGSPVPHLPQNIPQQYKRRFPCTTPTAWNTTAVQKEAPLYHTYRMEYHSSTKGGSPVPHLPHGIPQQYKRRLPCTTPTTKRPYTSYMYTHCV